MSCIHFAVLIDSDIKVLHQVGANVIFILCNLLPEKIVDFFLFEVFSQTLSGFQIGY